MTFEEFKHYNNAVDQHCYGNRDWLEMHECACREAIPHGKDGAKLIVDKLFSRAFDDRNLICAWEHVARRSGGTPGPDGLTVESIGPENRFSAMRGLRDCLRDGEYEHGDTRAIKISKSGGHGHRIIQIPNLDDRIVHRAIVQVLQPLLDYRFHPNSFGYRPKRNRLHALASAEILFDNGRTVVVVEDLKNAFDCVPQERLIEVLKKYANAPDFTKLVGKVIRTTDNVGIRQGAASSPLFLNLYAHHVLDRVWYRKHKSIPLIRYADDVALFCESVDEAVEARAALKELVESAGFQLKAQQKSTIADLGHGHAANWLGYLLHFTDDALDIRLSERAWASLQSKLSRAIQMGSSIKAPLRSWLGQAGAAYRTDRRDEYRERINRVLSTVGWEKRLNKEGLEAFMTPAYKRWKRIRKALRTATNAA